MSGSWPMIALGKVLKLQRRWVKVDALTDYTEIGIRSYGRGIFHKSPVSGASLGNKRVLRIEPGDLVFMNVFAWEGAVAVAGTQEAGTIGSHRFATYTPIGDVVDSHFLRLYFRTSAGRDLLGRVSPGSAGRNRTMNLAAFAQQLIPLPPIHDQRRIVSRIDQITAKIDEARVIRRDTQAISSAILDSAINDLWRQSPEWNRRELGDLASPVEGQIDPQISPYAGLPHINGEFIQSGTTRLLRGYRTAEQDGVKSGKFHFRPGAVLYSKIRPYLRKAAEVDIEGVCSADIYAFQTISRDILPRFFAYSLISPAFTRYANDLSGRTRMPKLNQKQMFAYDFPYPSLSEQQRIVDHLDRLSNMTDSLRSKHQESAAELDALLPSILDRAFKGEL